MDPSETIADSIKTCYKKDAVVDITIKPHVVRIKGAFFEFN